MAQDSPLKNQRAVSNAIAERLTPDTDLGTISITVINAAARNRLTGATGTNLQIASGSVDLSASDPAITTIIQLQIIGSVPIRYSREFLTVDDKKGGVLDPFFLPRPAQSCAIPKHHGRFQ